MQALAQEVFVAEELVDYILGLVHFTRAHARIYLGASPCKSSRFLPVTRTCSP